MAIAKGRTDFQLQLDEAFIVFDQYLSLIPSLIIESKKTEVIKMNEIIDAESDLDIKESLKTYLFDYNRLEDYNEMSDIFYKSYLISLCSFCESFAEKIYRSLVKQDLIVKITKRNPVFSDYWDNVNYFISNYFDYKKSLFRNIFELRNLVVHNSSRIDFCDTKDRLNIVQELVTNNLESFKIKESFISIYNDKYLKAITSLFNKELIDVLSKYENKLYSRK